MSIYVRSSIKQVYLLQAMCRWNHADLIAIETQDEQNWFAARARTFNRMLTL